jgi:cytochrome c551/c552
MKSIIVSMAVTVGLMTAGSAMAVDMPAVAKKNNCTACHSITMKLVGPAWQDVADKYKGQADAVEMLTKKISKGGGGVWGSMPMPANDPTGAKADDMKELAEFVMSLAK